MKHRAVQYLDDELLALYDTRHRAVYHEEDGSIVKYVLWEDEESGAVRIEGHEQFPVKREDAEAVVSSAFEALSDVGIKEKGDGIEEADDTVMQRLEDLGYA